MAPVSIVEKKPLKLDAASRRALDLLMELLALPGPSGDEHAVAEYISAQLSRYALPHGALARDRAFKQSPIPGSAGNLALRLPGTFKAPRRLLSGTRRAGVGMR